MNKRNPQPGHMTEGDLSDAERQKRKLNHRIPFWIFGAIQKKFVIGDYCNRICGGSSRNGRQGEMR
jgi:hypothetical protein